VRRDEVAAAPFTTVRTMSASLIGHLGTYPLRRGAHALDSRKPAGHTRPGIVVGERLAVVLAAM
jgi:hypothetical protein